MSIYTNKKKERNGRAGNFENQIDEWYKKNNIVSKLIPSEQKDLTFARKEDEVELDEEWERKNLRYGWRNWTPE